MFLNAFNNMKTPSKSDETRTRILAAAMDLFRDRGFQATTMREIAERAGVATGAAYYYFDSKDAIVLAFYDQAQEEMLPALEEAVAGNPLTVGNQVTLLEDGTHTFAASDFGFTDPVDGAHASGANALSAVILTTLPAAGTLTLSGGAVSAGQSIDVTDIPNLVFTPSAEANGAGYASFTFQVVDDGGTAKPAKPAAKAAKEDIVGLLVALESYMQRDHDADTALWRAQAEWMLARLNDFRHVAARYVHDGREHPVPRVELVFGPASGIDAHELVLALEEHDPDKVRGADVSYYSFGGLPPGPLPEGYLDVVPELVFEVRSSTDRWARVV